MNDKYHFCLDCPQKFLYPPPEDYDSGSCFFKNKYGDKVLQLKTMENDIELDADLMGKLCQKAISGYRNGNIFYLKALLNKNVIAMAVLEYPEDESETYDLVSDRLFKSFRFR